MNTDPADSGSLMCMESYRAKLRGVKPKFQTNHASFFLPLPCWQHKDTCLSLLALSQKLLRRYSHYSGITNFAFLQTSACSPSVETWESERIRNTSWKKWNPSNIQIVLKQIQSLCSGKKDIIVFYLTEKLKCSFWVTIKLVTIIMSNKQKRVAVMDSKLKESLLFSVGNWECQQT